MDPQEIRDRVIAELQLMAPKPGKPGSGMVCMLLRNEYDCAATRRNLFTQYPFAGKYVLSRRPRWV